MNKSLYTLMFTSLALSIPAYSQDANWQGDDSTAWNTASNWDTNSVPTGLATFDQSTATGLNVNLGSATDIGSIKFVGGGTWSFTGSPLTITSAPTGSGSRPFVFNSSGVVADITFNNQFIFSQTSTSSSLTHFDAFSGRVIDFAGGFSGNGDAGFVFRTATRTMSNAPFDATFSGGITNIDTFQWSFTNSILTLSSSSSVGTETLITGNTTTLRLAHDSALGTGTLRLNAGAASGAAITLEAVGGDRTYSNALTLNGGFDNPDSSNGFGVYVVSGDNDLTFSGATSFSRNSEFTVEDGRTFELSGNTSGKLLTKKGSGTMILSGASISHSGTTTVEDGTLLINGAMSLAGTPEVVVTETGVLGGTGSIARDVLFTSGVSGGGIFNPGEIGSIGTLTLSSDGDNSGGDETLTLANDTILAFDIGSGGAVDFVDVTGDLILDGILNLNDLGLDQAGDYTIVSYTGSLTDNGLEMGSGISGWDFNIFVDTGNKNVVLQVTTAIPELSTTSLLIGSGALGLVVLRRRRATTKA